MMAVTKSLMALIVGGFAGAVLRFEIGEWMPYTTDGFPWNTLLINWIGCFFLGWFLTVAFYKIRIPTEVRLGLGTGLTGSFTTFSTFSVQSVHLFTSGHSVMAGLYILLSVTGGVGLSLLGVVIGRNTFKKPEGELSL